MSDVNSIADFLMQSENPEPEAIELTGREEELAEMPVEEPEQHEEVAEQAEYEADDEEADDSDDTEWFNVKVNGEELQVTRDELMSGYQRDADYRRKTMALAEERKAFDGDKAKLDAKIGELDAYIERKQDELSEELMLTNPGEYLKKKTELEKAQKAAESAKAERQKELDSKRAEWIQNEANALSQAMGEEWTPEQRNADMKAAVEYLSSYGVGEDEINGIVDHRLWRVIFDAAKSTKVRDVSSKVKRQVREAPKTVKPGQKLPAGERKIQEAGKRLAQSNKHNQVDDLANYLNLIDSR